MRLQVLLMGARRGVMTSKRANKDFYKGTHNINPLQLIPANSPL